MQTLDRDEVSAVVAAPPDQVYELVADVTRMSEFSPEVVSCRWLDGATGPAVGARFEAVNVSPAGKRWKNRPVVTVAEPGAGVRLQPDRALRRHDRVALPLRTRGHGHPSRRELRGRAAGDPAGLVRHREGVRGREPAGGAAPGMTATLERLRAAVEAVRA